MKPKTGDDDDDILIRSGVHDTGSPPESTLHVGALTIMRATLATTVDELNATRAATTDPTQYDNLTNARQGANALRAFYQACIDRAKELTPP